MTEQSFHTSTGPFNNAADISPVYDLPVGSIILGAIDDACAKDGPKALVTFATLADHLVRHVDNNDDPSDASARPGGGMVLNSELATRRALLGSLEQRAHTAKALLNAAFADVLKTVPTLVEDGYVTVVNEQSDDPTVKSIQRRIDYVGVCGIAMKCGMDPEQRYAAESGEPAKYRKGPVLFWRWRNGEVEYAQVVYAHPKAVDGATASIATQERHALMIGQNTSELFAPGHLRSCKQVPEFVCRLVEQRGWTPLYEGMSPILDDYNIPATAPIAP